MKYKLKKKFYMTKGYVIEPQVLCIVDGKYYARKGGVSFDKNFVESNKEFFEKVKEDNLDERIHKKRRKKIENILKEVHDYAYYSSGTQESYLRIKAKQEAARKAKSIDNYIEIQAQKILDSILKQILKEEVKKSLEKVKKEFRKESYIQYTADGIVERNIETIHEELKRINKI